MKYHTYIDDVSKIMCDGRIRHHSYQRIKVRRYLNLSNNLLIKNVSTLTVLLFKFSRLVFCSRLALLNMVPSVFVVCILSQCIHMASGSFGDVFAWGAASSAFQTEGAWNVQGKTFTIIAGF